MPEALPAPIYIVTIKIKRLIPAIPIILLFSGVAAAEKNYYDCFNEPGNINWQVCEGSFSIKNKRYVAESQKGYDKFAVAISQIMMSEGSIQAKIRTEQIRGIGCNAFIVFGFRDEDNYYMVGAREEKDRWTIEKITDGVSKIIKSYNENIIPGKNYKIKALIKKGRIILYVNGLKKLSHYLGIKKSSGYTGLAVNNAVSCFDDIKIRPRRIEVLAAPVEQYCTFIPYYILPTKVVYGDGYKAFSITNNDYADVGVEIYGSRLAWQAVPGDSPNPEIFYYDGEHVHRVTFNDIYECTPSISSGGMAWQAYRDDGGSDVFFYDFNAVKRITNDSEDDYHAAVYGDKVVWCKHKWMDGRIMLYEAGDVAPIQGARTIFPRVSSGGIMYSSIRDNHLYLYDWNDIIDLGASDVEYTRNPHNQQINGDKVAWRRYVAGFHEVFLHDISTGITTQITDKEISSEEKINFGKWNYCQPSVNGDYVAWRSRREDVDYLRLYDGRQILTLASAPDMDAPFFGDGFLVWTMGKDETNMEVFIYNLASKEITRITNDSHYDRYPVASGKCIAWQKHDGEDYEIYLAYISSE